MAQSKPFARIVLPVLTIGLFALVSSGVRLYVHFAFAQTPRPITSCDNSVWDVSYRTYSISNDLVASGGLDCLTPTVSNVTIEGNGKTITTDGGNAVRIVNQAGIVIRSVVSSSDISIEEEAADRNLVDRFSGGGDVVVLDGDNNVITNSTIGSFRAVGRGSNAAAGEMVTNSTIEGTADVLVEITGSEQSPCPLGEHTISNNTIINHRSGTPTDALATFMLCCTSNSTVLGNVIRSTDSAVGLSIRDDASSTTFENNTFWTNAGVALLIAAGEPDKGYPSGNTFKQNTFRSENAPSNSIQAIGANNQFLYNTFWGNDVFAGGTITGGFGNTFDHNTFYVEGSGNRSQRMVYENGPPADTFTNNIFDYSGPSVFSFDAFSFNRMTSNYNLFHNRTGSVTFGSYGSIANWRSESVRAGHPEDANSLVANPMFVDPSTGNFSLTIDSPARSAGTNGSDIGAYSSKPTESCTERWTCGGWSTCISGIQQRTCVDSSSCGTIYSRPILNKACTQTDTAPPAFIKNLKVQ
ncbi:MAG: right-handed parallel beta-helix repeat-containing protein [Candidatus Kerfeldbacteria bacterium]